MKFIIQLITLKTDNIILTFNWKEMEIFEITYRLTRGKSLTLQAVVFICGVESWSWISVSQGNGVESWSWIFRSLGVGSHILEGEKVGSRDHFRLT